MKKAKPFLTQELLVNIYHAIVEPHFLYCSSVWDSIDETQTQQLQKLQNRAARIITGASYTTHTCDIFNQLNWSTLADQRKYHKALLMQKIIHGKAQSYLTEMFEKHLGTSL